MSLITNPPTPYSGGGQKKEAKMETLSQGATRCTICGAEIAGDMMGPLDDADTAWALCSVCTAMADRLAIPSGQLDAWVRIAAHLRHKAKVMLPLAGSVARDLLRLSFASKEGHQ